MLLVLSFLGSVVSVVSAVPPPLSPPNSPLSPLSDRTLVLSIRGSLELGDICTDLTAQLHPWDLGGESNEAGVAQHEVPAGLSGREGSVQGGRCKPDGGGGGSGVVGQVHKVLSAGSTGEGPQTGQQGGGGSGEGGQVHKGLLSAALYVGESTAAALSHAVEAFPGWPLLITGAKFEAGLGAMG